MRIRSMDTRRSHIVYNHAPFTGQGVSLYGTLGTSVRYRNLRIVGNKFIETTEFDIGGSSVTKTARLTSGASPVSSLNYSVPVAWQSQSVTFDVRQYADDVENESDNYRVETITFDGSGVPVAGIAGTAELIGTTQRDGGIVRIKFRWISSYSGTQPVTFTAIRTAGPTSPANVSVNYDSLQFIYEIDTPALSDASPYTYKIQAANGATTTDVLTGISVTADATGPAAPTSAAGGDW